MFADGSFTVAGTDRSMGIIEIARKAAVREALPPDIEPGLSESADYSSAVAWPNGTHICEVEIDEQTGRVALTRYVAVDDVGTMINPLLVEGQIFGGIAQGAGQALVEDLVYDPDSGQLVSGSFMDYTLPRADNFPNFDFTMRNVPCTTNPMGLNGSGEAGAIGAPPAVINAIVDAMAAAGGSTDIDMPATPDAIWAAANQRAAAE